MSNPCHICILQRFVKVQLLARGNAWQDSTPVEVISGELRIGKELNWLQGILREYFYSCYAMGTICIFVFQAFFWTLLGRYVEMKREQRRVEMEEWEQEHGHPDDGQGVQWEAVPGEDDDEWNDLPTEGHHETDRPVTPEHQSGNDANEGGEMPSEGAQNTTAGAETSREETSSDDARADRVVRGETEPYEVFTGELLRSPTDSTCAELCSIVLLQCLTSHIIAAFSLDGRSR